MKRIVVGAFACALALSATAALAQSKPPLKLGGILDMSGLYADITGPGSETAAKMAAEDFGGEVLGRKIEIIAADHLNKADVAASLARDMLDNQGVEMIYDVAASATALAAGEIAKARNKLIIFNGPATIALTNEACGPYTVHYAYDTFGQAGARGFPGGADTGGAADFCDSSCETSLRNSPSSVNNRRSVTLKPESCLFSAIPVSS